MLQSLFRQNCLFSCVHMRNTCLGPCIRNNAFSSLQVKEAAWLGLPHSTISVIGNSVTHFLHMYNDNYSTLHRCVSKLWLVCNIIWTYFCGWNGHAIGAKRRQFASCDCNTIYTAAYPRVLWNKITSNWKRVCGWVTTCCKMGMIRQCS